METVVIKAHTKSDARFFLNLAKRIGAATKTINTEEIEDIRLATLIERGLTTGSVSRNEIMKALRNKI
jgi:transcriptional/translational regulatory protein YebC/TACO1